jgi:sulfide:quinone oxidoreductase
VNAQEIGGILTSDVPALTPALGAGKVVAAAIIARHRGGESAPYQGDGHCYIEFGEDQVAEIYVNFLGGRKPSSDFKGATPEGVAYKRRFGSSRAARWFGL